VGDSVSVGVAVAVDVELGVADAVLVEVGVCVGIGLAVAVAVDWAVLVALSVGTAVALAVAVLVGGVGAGGHPLSALPTAPMISGMVTSPLPLASNAAQAESASLPLAICTPVTISLMPTVPSPLQSPMHSADARGTEAAANRTRLVMASR
jgi:hypothetical protein